MGTIGNFADGSTPPQQWFYSAGENGVTASYEQLISWPIDILVIDPEFLDIRNSHLGIWMLLDAYPPPTLDVPTAQGSLRLRPHVEWHYRPGDEPPDTGVPICMRLSC